MAGSLACVGAGMMPGVHIGPRARATIEQAEVVFYRRRIDPSACLVLWQVGVAGDRSTARSATGRAYRQLLVERLAEDYPLDHPVVLYEAATLPISTPRIEGLPLSGLPDARMDLQTTLVVPPAMPLQRDEAMLARIAALDAVAGSAPSPQGQHET